MQQKVNKLLMTSQKNFSTLLDSKKEQVKQVNIDVMTAKQEIDKLFLKFSTREQELKEVKQHLIERKDYCTVLKLSNLSV